MRSVAFETGVFGTRLVPAAAERYWRDSTEKTTIGDLARTTYNPARFTVYEITGRLRDLVVYRIVKSDHTDDPGFKDSLRSHYELGREPRNVQRRPAALHMALSTYRGREQAIGTAHRYPMIGSFVAILTLRPGLGINVAETLHPGHISVWGRPADLVTCVNDVFPVDG